MKKEVLNRISALLLTVPLALSFMGCGASAGKEDTKETTGEKAATTYRIAVCRSNDSPVYDEIVDGFADALYDAIGEAEVILSDRTIAPDESGEAVVLGLLSADNELVFSVGSPALSAAASATTDVPIVGAGVINYQNTLHLHSDISAKNRTTGRNVTGISAAPYIPAQLSLLIEATPELRTVGILYSPIDDNAIYQNEQLEKYLDEAGIPWKEYEITETEEALADENRESTEEPTTVILPATIVAASGKEGPNIDVEDIAEEGSLTGINSPSSTRTAKRSKTWTGGKAELIAAEQAAQEALSEEEIETDEAGGTAAEDSSAVPGAEVASDDSSTVPGNGIAVDNSAAAPDEGSATVDPSTEPGEAAASQEERTDATPEEIISLACEECSVLYISAESMLTDQIDTITDIATAQGVTTIGGDLTLGEKTLACIYADPYDQGYRAGKVACRILADGEDASEIKIGQPQEDHLQKLYQDSVAETLGLTFPKSFSDIDEFLGTYIPGTNTKRTSKN